jgi:hypothetical protein
MACCKQLLYLYHILYRFLTTALVVWVIKKIIEKFTYDFSTISGDSRRIARKKARKMGNVVDMISSFKDITESIKK